ncbi:3-oxoacid CoA-transferase subunit B [Ignatzschineria rhizosphaerae]|uniref:3-oxoacid CoA-transferase subunit B n=1 Tax=Ignatzschineria rhizosphaerae TaxID=2923279 RepID=A0ABY3X0H3_9GAMM|nr:3-oxoacid CoA-transferase subunit B [Ignatzschineria rhizosphaerae]UNM96388.1 3-oxoacid CoA-transferase subunit B [Ignatzschineria rhizosphaerae]
MTKNYIPLTRNQIAERVAQDVFDGAYVNLGIGLPTSIANYLGSDKEVFLHSENGLLGMGPSPTKGEEDPDLINAGKEMVTLLPGGSYFHHGDSFTMMRGGHIDICVLGAFQIAQNGDLANWHTGEPDAIPAVGGAMDLAIGAKNVWVATNHTTRDGSPKIVKECTYPLTGIGCVDRIYTDLAVIDVKNEGLYVIEMFGGITFSELEALTDALLIDATEN